MRLLKALIITLLLVLIVRAFGFTSCTIPFSGMENTLYQGERVIVNKWSYGLRLPLWRMISYRRVGDRPVTQGDIVVFNNPSPSEGEGCANACSMFINRCLGVSGDTLMLDQYLQPSKQTVHSPDYKSLYTYPADKEDELLHLLNELNIRGSELVGYQEELYIRSFSHYELYLIRQRLGSRFFLNSLQENAAEEVHPLVVPKKGQTVKVYPWNADLLRDALSRHEGCKAEVREGVLYVDGQETGSCTFTKDYHWMISDNTVNYNDSRSFGLVPKEYIVGRAVFIWFSKEKNTGLFDGYRKERFFRWMR